MTQIKHFYFSFIIALDLYAYKTLELEVRTKKYINVENLCELLLGMARDLGLGTSQKTKRMCFMALLHVSWPWWRCDFRRDQKP